MSVQPAGEAVGTASLRPSSGSPAVIALCSKSKWGRYFYRPHSHQRVGICGSHSVWQAIPPAFCSALGARCLCRVRLCFPAFAIFHHLASRFVTGARTGIRPYFVTDPICSGRSPRFTLPAPWHSRDRDPVTDRSGTPVPSSKALSYSYYQSVSWPIPMTLLALSSIKLACLRPKPFSCHLSDSAWTVATAST